MSTTLLCCGVYANSGYLVSELQHSQLGWKQNRFQSKDILAAFERERASHEGEEPKVSLRFGTKLMRVAYREDSEYVMF